MTAKRSLWDDKLSVGIKQFDDHHKKLLDLIIRLQEASNTEKNVAFVKDIFNELISYTKYHFSAEQRAMKQYEYTRFDEHVLMHNYFIKRLETYINKYTNNEKDVINELLVFLKDWLIIHILKIDKEYSSFLIEHGVE